MQEVIQYGRHGLLRFGPAVAAVLGIAVYLNALANGFAFDDVHIILFNSRVHDLAAWRDILLTPYWPVLGQELGLYRPVAILFYAVQWKLGGGSPLVFHAVSIVLHAAVTVLVFLLLERLAGRTPALVGALLFAVHPVHTEAVANVVGQAELIAAVAVLGACLVHMTRPGGLAVSWPRRVALVLLYALGIFTKESAVVLPALLVALDAAQRRFDPDLRGLRRYAHSLALPVFLMSAVLASYLLLRMHVLGGSITGSDLAPALPHISEHRLLNAFRAFVEFMRLMVVPLDLCADYAPGVLLPVESLTPMTLLGLALLMLVVVLAVLTPWLPALGLPAAWFLISMLTVSNLIFPIGVLVAERVLYLPSVAVSLAAAFAWRALAAAAARELQASPGHAAGQALIALRYAPALLVAVLVLFGGRTWIRNPDWRDTPAMLMALFRDHPESYRAQWMHANELFRLGRVEEAEAHFTLAHRLYDQDWQLLMSFGSFMMATDRGERAVELLESMRRLRRYEDSSGAARLLAHAYLMVGRYEDAARTLDQAAARGRGTFSHHPLRAYAFHGLGEHRRAVASWRSTLDDPAATAWINKAYLARAFAAAGSTVEAELMVSEAAAGIDDEKVLNGLAELRGAIRDGCYNAATSPVFGPCDPLGDWFVTVGQTPVPTALHRNVRPAGAEQAAGPVNDPPARRTAAR